jgi:anaerobic selenocysteine-containing dehydrogenase
VLIDLGSRLKLPGFVCEAGKPKYADYADYIVNHERRPGVGPLSGWRGNGDMVGRGAPNPAQLDRYIENGGFSTTHVPEAAQFFKAFNADYQNWAVGMGFFDAPNPYVYQLYVEPLAKFRLAARGFGDRQPPEHLRERIARTFDPLPIWYPPFEGELAEGFPLHAITQRPAAMYHAWGSQNAWLRQIHGRNPLYVPGPICNEHSLKDGDWVWLTSHHGRIKVQIARMDAVNERTVWTWNAIGKRKGAWALSPDAPEATKGFLLNHLISELLPEQRDGMRWLNSDPITGQAAWYDLRVRIEKAEAGEEASEPAFPPIASPVGQGPEEVRYGEEWT